MSAAVEPQREDIMLARRRASTAYTYGKVQCAIHMYRDICITTMMDDAHLDNRDAIDLFEDDVVAYSACTLHCLREIFHSQSWLSLSNDTNIMETKDIHLICTAFYKYLRHSHKVAFNVGKCLVCVKQYKDALPLLAFGVQRFRFEKMSPSDDAELMGICLLNLDRQADAMPWLSAANASILVSNHARVALARCLFFLNLPDLAINILQSFATSKDAYWYDVQVLASCYMLKKDMQRASALMFHSIRQCAAQEPIFLPTAKFVYNMFCNNHGDTCNNP